MREFFAALNSNSKNQKQEQERKRQHRPRKIGGREAGFSATQLAKARAQPQRASALFGDPVRPGRNDDSCVGVRKNKQEQEQRQRRNTGISPLRRQSAPPSVEMTFVWWIESEQATTKARTTTKADPYGMTNKRIGNGNSSGNSSGNSNGNSN